MTEHEFRTQHLTYHIHGYSANPSNDPAAPRIVGSIDNAAANGFQNIDALRKGKAVTKELKRKRKKGGELDVVEGEGAYVGPWGAYEADAAPPPVIEDEESEDDEADEQAAAAIRSKAKARRSAFGQETSIFHGKSMVDYQGRTYMSPPLAAAPHLTAEAGSQETYIPKVCVHTWTGHTQGVSVIRTFPGTGHLLLSGSMDTKIKVCSYPRRWLIKADWISGIAMGCLSRRQLPTDFHGSPQSRQRCDLFERWSEVLKLWI